MLLLLFLGGVSWQDIAARDPSRGSGPVWLGDRQVHDVASLQVDPSIIQSVSKKGVLGNHSRNYESIFCHFH